MTIAEVLIASSILVVCLIALAAVLGGVITSSGMARSRDEAMNLANARVETYRGLPYDSVGVHYADGRNGEPAGSILTPDQDGRFVVTTKCDWVQSASGRAAYKRIKVTVSWLSPSPGSIDVNTIIYGKSGISVAGDFDVKLRYRESSGPVSGSDVTLVTADGGVHKYTTDAAGEILFGQVPVGACTLSVAPPTGYIVDATTLANAVVSTDAVSTAVVYVQHPASATVRVVDMNGAALAGASVSIRRTDGAVTASAASASNGTAAFGQLLYGDYTATVTGAGYASASLQFSVMAASNAPVVDFRMSAAAVHGIRARIFDSNGTQVPGAAVALTTQAGVPAGQGVAGSNGEISFALADDGTYIVAVTASGYVSQSMTVVYHSGNDTVVDFSLSAVATKGNMHVLTTGKNHKLQSLRVSISGPGGYFSDTQYSSDSGDLYLNNLVPGSYAVQIYNDSGSAVTAIINAGQTADVAISQRK